MSIEIVIDGVSCSCEPGEYLADIAKRNGIAIPLLCGTKESLLGRGCCRVCIVEVVESGRTKIVASCIYPVSRPCEVYTKSERILRERGVIFALLGQLAPESELIADMAKSYETSGLESLQVVAGGEKCILCGLCIEACKALGTEAITTVGRGVAKKVSTPYDDPSFDCIGCASCANVCPTGSIVAQENDKVRSIWGRDFQLVRCEVCDEVLGTVESLAYVVKGFDAPGQNMQESSIDDEVPLCSKHKALGAAVGLAVFDGAVM